MACTQCCGIEKQFNDKVAKRELRRFRRRGPRKTTTRLLGFIKSKVKSRNSLLDIGGGIGAIQHEMYRAGTESFTSVDASPAYVTTSRSEAERLGYAARARYILGDFVEMAAEVPKADVVTLDRVVCCYPDVDSLLGLAASKAHHAVGMVYPREDAYVRAGVRLGNWVLRLFRKDFQAFVHPHARIESILQDHGFRQTTSQSSLLWIIALYAKG